MGRYEVELSATFRKTVYVEADNPDEAEEIAREATTFDDTWEVDGFEYDSYVRKLGKQAQRLDVKWLMKE